MPINKFTTLGDLARQAKIISGETATFDGKIQVGIPFSGYPTGVDTGTTVSLGIVSSEAAVFSGNTGTTIFDVSNTGSTNYSPIFSGYSGSVWTNVLFSGNTSGLTLPITPLSADTQIVGPIWTLTQTGMTGDYVIGTQYTGYSVTYSFFNVSQFGTGFTYSGFTTASQENFSAGTLDYKGPLDYISTKEDASVEGRLTTNKITITNGASASTIGYVLTQTGENGEAEWVINASADTNTYVTGGTLTGTDLTLDWNTGGSANPIDLSGLEFTGNTSGDCINDIFIKNIHSCSPLNINPLDEGSVYFGSTSGVTIDLANIRFGIGTSSPQFPFQIVGANSTFYYDPTSVGGRFNVSGNTNIPRYDVSIDAYLTRPSTGGAVGMRSWNDVSYPGYGKVGDMFMYVGNEAYGLNIINSPGTNTEDYIRFYAGTDATSTPDIHIQGSGVTRGYVGIGTGTPTEKLHISGGDMLVENTNGKFITDIQNTNGPLVLLSGGTNGITRYGVIVPTFDALTMGIRGGSDVTFTDYGKNGDAFVRSSNPNNGLNIISEGGTGTDDYIRFYAGQNASSGNTPDLYIQGSGTTRGNVAIGTDSPSEKLVVDGNVKIIGNVGAVTRSLTIGDDDEITFTTLGGSVTDNVNIISQTNNAKINLKNGTINDRYSEFAQYNTYGVIAFNLGYTGNSESYIANGSTSGSTIFRVGDEAASSDVMYMYGKKSEGKVGPFSGVTDSKVTYIKGYLTVEENASFSNVGSTAFANDIRIDANGILTTNTSDERLKENINYLIGSLETVLQLSGVSYNWKDRNSGGDDLRYGFIAQRVDEVDSNLTVTNQVDGYMGLKSDCFTPLIVESIKEIHNNPSIPNYTPTSSGDTYGNVGNITTDDNYLYIKTNNGWKRTSLESF